MIKVVVGNNMKQVSVIVDEQISVKDAASAAGFDASTGMVSVNGCFLGNADLNKSLASLGAGDNTRILVNFKKADNA